MSLLQNSNLSQIYRWKQWICRTLILSLRGNKTQSIDKQDEWVNSPDSYPLSTQPPRVVAFLVTERLFTTISEPGTGYLINIRSMDDYRNSPIFLCWRIPNSPLSFCKVLFFVWIALIVKTEMTVNSRLEWKRPLTDNTQSRSSCSRRSQWG